MFEERRSKVLMIAVEYPPCRSGGVQRTLKFSRYLPQFGWQPIVLTADVAAYEEVEAESESDFPEGVQVFRSYARDSLRHLTIKGKYLDLMAYPDRYVTWFFSAIVKGLSLIREHKPDLIYTTFPYYTTHWIGLCLAKMSGVRWIADFRDPAHHHYLMDPRTGEPDRQYTNPIARWVDRRTVANADHMVFATASMKDFYAMTYPALNLDNLSVIPNGYNDDMFDDIDNKAETPGQDGDERLLLHSGILSLGRNPETLINALVSLRAQHPDDDNIQKLRIRFRGAEAKKTSAMLISEHGLQDVVEFLPSLPYEASVKEMQTADYLLLMQGEAFRHQIPGKAYEYIATGKPIMVLGKQGHATANLMQDVAGCLVCDMDDQKGIESLLSALPELSVEQREVDTYGRRHRTKQLADIFNQMKDP